MKYITFLTLLISLTFAYVAVAEDGGEIPQILLSEISLGNQDSAANEYIELSNTSIQEWDLEGVILEYKSKTGTNWQTKSALSGGIAPYGSYLISNYLEGSKEFSGSLASTGGHLRLVKNDVIIDVVAWGLADSPEESAAPAHGSAESLKRYRDEDGILFDTDHNFNDWFVSSSPSPRFDEWTVEDSADTEDESNEDIVVDPEPEDTQGDDLVVDDDTVVEQPEEDPVGIDDPVAEPPVLSGSSLPIKITELLPDPVSPMTDAEHEFVELINPNATSLNLEGYILQSGSEWRYKFTLPSYVLEPGERIALYSATSGLTLSNSGSQVRILGPDESEHDFVEYEKAKAGASWSLGLAGWQWSNPTPNTQNTTIATAVAATASTASTSTATVGAVKSAATTSLEKKTIEYPEAVSGDDSESSDENSAAAYVEEEEPPRGINNLILAGIAGLTVLYAVYEYRNDIRIRGSQLARYLKLRTKTWGNS